MWGILKDFGTGVLLAIAVYALWSWASQHRVGFSFYVHDARPPVTIHHEWQPDYMPHPRIDYWPNASDERDA